MHPEQAEQGGYTELTFRVPNERDRDGTVKVEVRLPAEHPISSVRTTPMQGWTAAMTQDGDTVRTITWTAAPGVRIAPGQYQEFEISAGPLPQDAEQLVIPAVQTYDNGEVVAWDDPTARGAEPEHPAPTVELAPAQQQPAPAAASTPGTAPPRHDSTTHWLARIALIVSALALGLATGAVLRTRRNDSR